MNGSRAGNSTRRKRSSTLVLRAKQKSTTAALNNTLRANQRVIKIPRNSTKKDDKGTFLSQEAADQILDPTYDKVEKMVDSLPYSPVPGWLSRLKSWFSRMARGNFDPKRTPFWENLTFPQLVRFMQTFVSTRKAKVVKLIGPYFYDLLLKVEEHQAEKISPRGCFPSADAKWLEDFFDKVWADKPMSKEVNTPAWYRVLHRLSALIPAHSLDVNLHTMERMWAESEKEEGTSSESALNTDTNSCFPSYVKHWLKSRNDPDATQAQLQVSREIKGKVTFIFQKALVASSWRVLLPLLHFVATANQRTNVGSGPQTKDNTWHGKWMSKFRGVIAMPKEDTCLGKILYIVMLPAIRTIVNPNGCPVFLGLFHPAQIDKGCQLILETAEEKKLTSLSIDYSAFDSTLAPWLMWDVAQAVSVWMTKRMANLWLALVYAFIYQTTLISLLKVYPEKASSMKSGAWLTNMLDSLCNLAAQYYAEETSAFGKVYVNVVHGDDGIVLGERVTPETYEKPAEILGLSANKDKQYYERQALAFCQKVHFYRLPGGIYPLSRVTAAITTLEDDDARIETDRNVVGQFPYVLSFRTICRMETAAFNPNFRDYVIYVRDMDRIKLGVNIGLKKLAYFAGSYAVKYLKAVADKPWKQMAMAEKGGFEALATSRVLSGEIPPRPGKELYNWVYRLDYDKVHMHGPDQDGNWNLNAS